MIASRIAAMERRRVKRRQGGFYIFMNPTDDDRATWSRLFDGRPGAPYVLFFIHPGLARKLDPAPPEWPGGAIRDLTEQ